MQVRMIDRAPVTVACLRHTGPYGEPVGAFWRSTVMPWIAREGWLDRPCYGIALDDPSITAPERCRYDAGVEVDAAFVAAAPVAATRIPGGRYAALDFVGGPDQIGAAWTWLHSQWLPGSGLQLDLRPCFELYDPAARLDGRPEDFRCRLCVPIAPDSR